MVIRFGPGSLVSRERPTLAISRLIEPYQVPLAVVTNGQDAEVLDGETGRVVGRGLAAIPARPELTATLAGDHRATDGHKGGLFLEALNRNLQEVEKL